MPEVACLYRGAGPGGQCALPPVKVLVDGLQNARYSVLGDASSHQGWGAGSEFSEGEYSAPTWVQDVGDAGDAMGGPPEHLPLLRRGALEHYELRNELRYEQSIRNELRAS